eukprot:1159782-Pelagomonas_calceolata.AAC.3
MHCCRDRPGGHVLDGLGTQQDHLGACPEQGWMVHKTSKHCELRTKQLRRHRDAPWQQKRKGGKTKSVTINEVA